MLRVIINRRLYPHMQEYNIDLIEINNLYLVQKIDYKGDISYSYYELVLR